MNNNHCTKHFDKFIGNKIYSLRLARGLSRQALGSKIGVSHQQVEKYEKGRNKIFVGRLVFIAKALDVDIMYFYEGYSNDEQERVSTQHQRMCLAVARNFMKITDSKHQNAINDLIKHMVSDN